MALRATCRCGESFAAPEKLAGKRARCPSCGEILQIPAAARKAPATERPKNRGSVAPQGGSTQGAPRSGKSPSASSAARASQRAAASSKPASAPPGSRRAKSSAAADAFDLGDLSAYEAGRAPLGAGATRSARPAPTSAPTSTPASPIANPLGWHTPPAQSQTGSIPLPLLLAIGGAGAAVLVIGVIVVGVIWTASQTPEQNVAEVNSGLPNDRVVPEVRGGGQAHQFGRMNRRDAVSGDTGVPAQPSPGVATGDHRDDPRLPQRPPERFGKPPQSKDGQPGPGAGTPGAVEDQSSGADQTPGMGPGTLAWYTAGGRLRGAREVPDQDLVIYHYSWLCEVLPHLGQQEVYDQFDFKKRCIDSPNTRPSRTLIPQFLNPADQRQRLDDIRFPGFALTHFAGMSGVEDAPNDLAAEYPRSDPRAGIFGYDDVAKPSEITDGMSNTIMVIGTGKLAAPWVIGGGATVRGARPPYFGKHNGFGSAGLAQRGTISMMADGTIRHLSAEIEPEVFKALCTTHGAEEVDLNSSRIGPPAPDWYQP